MQTTVIAVLGLVSLFIGWILTLILPGLRVFAWGILALGVIFLGVAFIIDFRRVSRALVSRRGRFGTSTTIVVSMFTGVILLINAISIGNNYRFDFTGLAEFTLTSQTKDVLQNLETEVKVIGFFTRNNPIQELAMVSDHAINMLSEYENQTEKLIVEYVDPDTDPDQARQYGLTEFEALYGTVVFESGNR